MPTPSIRIDLLIFIGEHRLKSAAMQIQLNDIAGGKRLLGQVREEPFVDHSFSCNPYGTLLRPFGMRRHHHPAGHPLRSHWDFRAIVQTAYHVAFGTLLELIGRQVQARLNLRMIEQAVVFATGHERKTGEIGKHRSIAILPIEPEQRAFW